MYEVRAIATHHNPQFPAGDTVPNGIYWDGGIYTVYTTDSYTEALKVRADIHDDAKVLARINPKHPDQKPVAGCIIERKG